MDNRFSKPSSHNEIMASLPLFSILVANYNNAQFLHEAIDSILKQSYSNWEVVVVDDKSTDNSFDIYDSYREDTRFRFYFNDKNRGCGYTKRRCAELAHGELCGFLDPDDALMPKALETMVNAHNEHPECSLIYSTCYRYSGDRNAEMPIWDYIGPIPADKDFIICRDVLVSHFVSFKKSCYDKTDGIDKSLAAAVDRDLYYRLEEQGQLLHIPVPLYYYRINNVRSISIGSKKADIKAYHNCIKSELNAICRRMGTPLMKRNEEQYLRYMRVILNVYYHTDLYSLCDFVRYCFYYWKGRKYSLHAVSHIYKIIRNS